MDKLKAMVGKEAKDAAQRSQLLIDTIEEQVVDIRRRNYEVEWDASGVRQPYSRELLSAEEIAADWDPRWLDWFIKQDAVNLASAFARPGHRGVQDYLLASCRSRINAALMIIFLISSKALKGRGCRSRSGWNC